MIHRIYAFHNGRNIWDIDTTKGIPWHINTQLYNYELTTNNYYAHTDEIPMGDIYPKIGHENIMVSGGSLKCVNMFCWKFVQFVQDVDRGIRWTMFEPKRFYFLRKLISDALRLVGIRVGVSKQLKPIKTMPDKKTTVYVHKYNGSGCPVIKAPEPGELFVNEDDHCVTKRKSPVEPLMRRHIVEAKQVNAKFGLAEGTVLSVSTTRRPSSNELFISAKPGNPIGKQGVAGWNSRKERKILTVVLVPMGKIVKPSDFHTTQHGAKAYFDHVAAKVWASVPSSGLGGVLAKTNGEWKVLPSGSGGVYSGGKTRLEKILKLVPAATLDLAFGK